MLKRNFPNKNLDPFRAYWTFDRCGVRGNHLWINESCSLREVCLYEDILKLNKTCTQLNFITIIIFIDDVIDWVLWWTNKMMLWIIFTGTTWWRAIVSWWVLCFIFYLIWWTNIESRARRIFIKLSCCEFKCLFCLVRDVFTLKATNLVIDKSSIVVI